MDKKYIVNKLKEEELHDFSVVVYNTFRELCLFADKYGYDRDNTLAYFADRVSTLDKMVSLDGFHI